jgi:type IV pilus assembly protein PilB
VREKAMPEIDITDKIGYTLLKKGIIDFETLEKSLKMKDSEENKKNRKNLGQILVSEFGADHDAVFREVANLYAFREIYLTDEKIDDARAAFIKKLVDGLPEQQRDMMIQSKMLPFKYDERQADKLTIIAADPTDRNLPIVARSFNVKKYEICYVRLKDLQVLMEKVAPAQNEFLKLLQQDEAISVDDGSSSDEAVDEQALEAEINKSALVNLFEGCIVEAVRRGVRHPRSAVGRQQDVLHVPGRWQPPGVALSGEHHA